MKEKFMEWKNKIKEKVEERCKYLAKTKYKYSRKKNKVLKTKECTDELERLQKMYVMVPVDKAANNTAFVCKYYYLQTIKNELQTETYEDVRDTAEQKIQEMVQMSEELGIKVPKEEQSLPLMYATIKMHKQPIGFRYIVASKRCVTKQVAKQLTKILKLVQKQEKRYCDTIEWCTGVNMMWIAQNNQETLKYTESVNKRKSAKDIDTFDFSTLYTKINLEDLKDKLKITVDHVFKGGCSQKIRVDDNEAEWEKSQRSRKKGKTYGKEEIHKMIDLVIDNALFMVGGKVIRQKIGIPMGIDPAPYIANLYLYYYEFTWLRNKMKSEFGMVRKNYSKINRFIDDLLAINNGNHLNSHWKEIYPNEMILKKENEGNKEATFLDLTLTIENKKIVTKMYDKRDNFSFDIVSFPDISGNISEKTGYATLIGQLIRINRNCLKIEDMMEASSKLIHKLETKGYDLLKIKCAAKKTFHRNAWICKKYEKTPEQLLKSLF
jgi:hypothetical protein